MRTILLALVPFFWLGGEAQSQTTQSGPVSVYADLYQGKATASGMPYDRGALSAAHASLPFGTWIRVANFETGRMVDVRVNDRKREDGRLVTISRAAADAIGLSPTAIAPGSLLVLNSGASAPPVAGAAAAPSERKFRPLSGLFGKNPDAAPTASTVAPAPAPIRYGIPADRFAPPAPPQGGGLFQKSGKAGGLFAGKSAPPASAYPSTAYPSAPAAELMAMNAPVARTASPGPAPTIPAPGLAPVPVPPTAALPPASPSAPYRVQFGAFRRFASADELSRMLDGAGIGSSVFAAPGSELNVVVTDAGFRSADEAQRWIDYEGARRGWTDRPVVIR